MSNSNLEWKLAVSIFEFYLYLAIALIGGFWLGAWVQRLFVWYPFGSGPLTGRESMVGKIATVAFVKPNYFEVVYDSRIWKATSLEGVPVQKDEKVVIRDVHSNTLIVEPIGTRKEDNK